MTVLTRMTVRDVRGGDGYGYGGEGVGVWIDRVQSVSMQNALIHGVTGGEGRSSGIWGAMVHGGFAHGIRGYGSSLDLEHATIHGVNPGQAHGEEPTYWDGMSAEIYVDDSPVGDRSRVAHSALTGSPRVPAIAFGPNAHVLLEYSLVHGVNSDAAASGTLLERGNLYTAPGYSDAPNGDFTPHASSALVDAAETHTVDVDVLGHTRDTTPDIGALELLR